MNSLIRNQLKVNILRELSPNPLRFLSPNRCLSHLNQNSLNSRYSVKCNENNRICLQNTIKSNARQCVRDFKTSNFHLKNAVENYSPFDLMDGIYYKIRRLFGYTTIPKWRLQNSSVYLYESCTDAIDIEKFIKFLRLPDTILTWFLVTQVHVWMCMTRAMSEGAEGWVLRNELVARMWEDLETRLKKLTHLPSKVQKQILEDLLQQFQASIFAYDEGFLTDDRSLAAALWRTLFMYEEVDPQNIETMVFYIREQLDHLQKIGTETYFLEGKIVWKDFPQLYP